MNTSVTKFQKLTTWGDYRFYPYYNIRFKLAVMTVAVDHADVQCGSSSRSVYYTNLKMEEQEGDEVITRTRFMIRDPGSMIEYMFGYH